MCFSHMVQMRSGQFDIDYAKQVTKLADYSGVAITVSNDYEINDTAYLSLLFGIRAAT